LLINYKAVVRSFFLYWMTI